jgi:hypothetical protein
MGFQRLGYRARLTPYLGVRCSTPPSLVHPSDESLFDPKIIPRMIVFLCNFRYAGGMDVLLDLAPPPLAVLIVPTRAAGLLLDLAAELAARGPLLVLDGGNRFNAYPAARRLRGSQVLARLHVARAFTCFQMLALLQATETDGPALLVLDPLATFNDENVPVSERLFTFRRCVAELTRLSRRRPVGIGLLNRPDPLGMIEYLAEHASRAGSNRVYRLEPEPPAASLQPRLL